MSKINKKENFNNIISILKKLNKNYPEQGVAKHIAEATTDTENLWLLKDNELLDMLTIYKTELDLNNVSEDHIEVNEKELARIIREGKNLNKIDLEDVEEDEEFFEN